MKIKLDDLYKLTYKEDTIMKNFKRIVLTLVISSFASLGACFAEEAVPAFDTPQEWLQDAAATKAEYETYQARQQRPTSLSDAGDGYWDYMAEPAFDTPQEWLQDAGLL